MRIIVFTNLESWQRNGILSEYGLNFRYRHPEPIKGIGWAGVEHELIDREAAAKMEFVLCHQSLDKSDIADLIAPGIATYIVLHNSSLRGLYSRVSIELAPAKVFYRYETSERGETVDLLHLLQPLRKAQKKIEYYQTIEQYLATFQRQSFRLFKKELINHPIFIDYQRTRGAFEKGIPIPYLWNLLFSYYPSLNLLLEQFFTKSSREEKMHIRLKVHRLLFPE